MEILQSCTKPSICCPHNIHREYQHYSHLTCVSDHWQCNWLFNCFFRLPTMKSLKFHITGLLWGETTHDHSVGNFHSTAGPRPTTLEEDREIFVDFSSILCLWFQILGMRTYNFFDWVSNTAWPVAWWWIGAFPYKGIIMRKMCNFLHDVVIIMKCCTKAYWQRWVCLRFSKMQ